MRYVNSVGEFCAFTVATQKKREGEKKLFFSTLLFVAGARVDHGRGDRSQMIGHVCVHVRDRQVVSVRGGSAGPNLSEGDMPPGGVNDFTTRQHGIFCHV